MGALSSSNTLAGQAGNIVSSAGSATLTTVTTTNTTYAGDIGASGGTMNLVKEGSGTTTLTGTNAYTGSTSILGGTLTLRDSGALTGTTGNINVVNSTLTLDNSGLAFVTNRIPTSNTLALTGSTLNYLAGEGSNSVSVGPVTVATGASTINGTLWGSTSNYGSSISMVLASLTEANSTGTLNFTNTGGTFGAAVSQVNGAPSASGGSNVQVLVTSPVSMTNGIIGGWAVVNGSDWAVYRSTADSVTGAVGIGNLGYSLSVLNGATQNPYGIYSANAITAGTAVDNITTGATTYGVTNRTINSFKVSGAFTITENALDQLLTINTGGLLTTGGAASFQSGRYTAGAASGQTLYLYNNTGGTETVQAQIVDNYLGSVNLVKSGSVQTNIGVSPIVETTLSALATGSTQALVTVPSTAGMVVGQSLGSTVVGANSGSIVTGIISATQFSIGQTIATATTTAVTSNTALNLPTTQVLNNLSIPTAAANTPFTVTVPAGTSLLPGMVVTQATATGGTTATENATATQGAVGTTISMSNTAGVTVGQLVTGTGIAAGSYVASMTANTSITLNQNTSAAVTSGTALSFTGGNFQGGTVTVLSVSGTTATLIDSVATIGTASGATLMFAPEATQTASTTTTSGQNTFTIAANTLGLNVGQLVTGTGITAGTYITAYNQSTGLVTLSANATASGAITASFTAPAAVSQITSTTNNSTTAAVLSSSGMFVGEVVSGQGIAPGTTVASIVDASHITLSTAATATATSNAYFGIAPVGTNVSSVSVPTVLSTTTTAASSNSTTLLVTALNTANGELITGTGIPAGTTIVSGGGTSTLTLSQAATVSSGATVSYSPSITLTSSQVAGIVAGMTVTGYGINPGTTVLNVSGNTVTLSAQPATVASGATGTWTFGAPLTTTANNVSVTGTTTNNSATVTLASTAGLYAGMKVTGVNIPAGTTIATVASATTITLSNNTNVSGAGTGTLTITAPATLVSYSQGYSGQTVVNQGLLQIGGTGSVLGGIQVPGDLVLNNASATQSTNNGSIASTSNIIINGTGTLTLSGNNTVKSVTFNGTGGTSASTITGGTLVITNGVTSANDNLAVTPTIASNIELTGSNLTVTTSGASPDNLSITGVIANVMGGTASPAGLIKAGSGSLVLTGASTFTGGVQLNAGSLILGASSSSVTAGVPLISTMTGPLGIGTLTIAGGTSILSDGTARTVANAVTVNGNFSFGGLLSGNNLTLSGQVSLGSTTRQITVSSPSVTGTLSGGVVAAGSAGLTKLGAGILALSSAGDTWSGATTITGGVLQLGAAQVLGSSALVVAAGAEINLNAFGAIFGSLAGDTTSTGGLITNTGASATLTVGSDNTSTTFAGAFTATTAANLALTKIGTGTLTLTGGLSNATGALTVSGGTILLSGNGAVQFGSATADTLNSGGTLALNNTATNVVNRLASRSLTLQGGALSLTGTGVASTNASEAIGTLLVQYGGSTITLNGGTGGNTTLAVTSLTNEALNSGGSALIQGLSTTAGAGTANMTTGNALAMTTVTQGGGSNGSTNMTIRPDIIADTSSTGTGTGFLTKDTGTGTYLRPLATSELATTLSTSTVNVNVGNFGSVQNYSVNTSLNSLTLNTGNGIVVTGGGQLLQGTTAQKYTAAAALAQLTVNTGGILDTYVGTNTINAGSITTTSNAQFEIHVTGTSSTILNINAFLLGNTGGLVKADGGTLTLNNAEYYAGPTTVNGGVLNLNGGAQTLLVTPSATVATVYDLQVNAGTLNLNGDQAVARIGSLNYTYTAGSTAGTISNTSGSTINLTSVTGTASAFGGVIGGGTTGTNAINFYKDGSSTLTLTNASTYSGSTNIIGGTLTLQDSGSLASTTININTATLNLTNNVLSNNSSRVAATAAVNMNGGTLVYTGANYVTSTETIGSSGAGVTAATGFNTLTATAAAATTNTVTALTIGTLTRTTGAAVNFTGSTLGSTLPGTSQIFLSNVNGASTTATLTGGTLGSWLTGGILGGAYTVGDNWATYGGTQQLSVTTTFNSTTVTLATGSTAQLVVGQAVSGGGIPAGSYITAINSATSITISQLASSTGTANATFNSAGVTALNSLAYTAVSATGTLGAATTSTGNYSFQLNSATLTQLATGGNTVNSLQIAPTGTTGSILDLNGGLLTVTSGGILRTSAQAVASSIQNGQITSGTSELTVSTNISNPLTISAVIQGSGMNLVKSGTSSTGALTLTGNNTYTGATYVDSGVLTLSTAGANGTTTLAVPGNLTINSGASVTETLAGEIAQSSAVTINGSGVLTLTGANTLASLTLNATLGGAAQTNNVVIGTTSLTLTAANAITATNNNFGFTPVISGTALLLQSSTATGPSINVSGLSTDTLIISAPITSVQYTPVSTLTNTSLLITGGGSVVLSGASTYTGGTVVDTNTSVIFGVGTTGTITNGPVGTGTLTLNNNSTILSDGTTRTVANATSVQGNFTFGGTVAGNSVILSGNMALASGAHTVTVTSPQVSDTISGTISGASSTGFTKAGAGTLVFSPSSANTYSGSTTVAGGVLQLGIAGGVPSASSLIINAGAAFDINGKAGSVGSLAGDTSTTGGLVTNNSATAATLTIGNDGTNTTFAGVITSNTLANLALTKTGTGNQTLSGINTYTGATTVSGGTLTLQNNSTSSTATLADTAITVGSAGTFAISSSGTGSTTVNAGNTATAAAGATLTLNSGNFTMADGALSTFNLIQGSSVATGLTTTGTSVLTFDIGSTTGTNDLLAITKAASIGSGTQIAINVVGSTLTTGNAYTLITASSGLGSANFGLAASGLNISAGGYTYAGSLATSTSTAEILTIGAQTSTLAAAYWDGSQSSTWSTYNSGSTNWSSTSGSITEAGLLPAFNTNVFFTVANPPGASNLSTTLGSNFTINSLNFTGTGTSATSAVSITGNTLTINATSANGNTAGNGINVAAGNGNVTIASNVVLGNAQTWTNNSTSTLAVSNTGSTITGTNTNLTVAGTGNTTIGDAIQTGSGSVTMSGSGTLALSGTNTYTGATNINGGIVQVASAGALGGTSSISFGGGTLQFTASNTTDYSSSFSTAPGQAVSVDTNGQNVTFATSLTSSGGSLAKAGAGTLTVTGTESYSGTTTVSGGTLQVGDGINGSLTGSGAVTVAGGTSLGTAAVLSGGTSTITGGVINGNTTLGSGSNVGIVAPGVGTSANQALSFAGNLTVNAGSQIDLRITNATANLSTVNNTDYNSLMSVLGGGTYSASGNNVLNILGSNLAADSASLNALQSLTNHDLVNVGGTLTVSAGSTPAFQLIDSGYSTGGNAAIGDMFKLIDWGTLSVAGTGTLTASDFTLPSLATGLFFDTSAFQSYGIIVVVPEPSRVLLLLLGLCAFFIRRRRRSSF